MLSAYGRAYPSVITGSSFRLLTVTPWFFPDTGGIERHVLEVARRLVERGVAVTVAAADNTRARTQVDEVDGVVVRRVPAWPRHRDYLLAPAIYRLTTDPAWDLVHVQSCYTAVPPLAMLAARRVATPYVVTPHGGNSSLWRRPFRPAQRRILAPLLRHAEAVIALSKAQQSGLLHEFGLRPERTRVIPNGTDLVDHVDPAAVASARATHGRPLLVSSGRLERFKGHHRLIEALPHMLPAYPDATVRILGDGPYKAELLRRAGELGVADRVHIEFFPMDERPKLAAAMAAADIGVLLSEHETQPLAILELAALGVPAVVADAHGLRELVADGVAHSIPLGAKPEELARTIMLTLEQPASSPPALPSWETVTDELLTVYHEVMRRGRRE